MWLLERLKQLRKHIVRQLSRQLIPEPAWFYLKCRIVVYLMTSMAAFQREKKKMFTMRLNLMTTGTEISMFKVTTRSDMGIATTILERWCRLWLRNEESYEAKSSQNVSSSITNTSDSEVD